MDAKTHQLLFEVVDPLGFEVPGNDWRRFPHDELRQSVLQVHAALQRELGVALQRDGQVQDASFHDELSTLYEIGPRQYGVDLGIRFSNFGRLFTVYTTRETFAPDYDLLAIISIVERHGWRHIPYTALDAPYNGVNAKLCDGKTTWWVRYFDYL